MNQHIKKMLKFTALFTTGTVAIGVFSIGSLVRSYKENTVQDLKVKTAQEKLIEDSNQFILEARAHKEIISKTLKDQQNEYLQTFDPKSEEMPELLVNILDILDGKSSESALELVTNQKV